MSFPTFTEFFRALWGYDPFPWQAMLAERVASGEWPEWIDLPTASGKTACLDVAVYSLAAQAQMPLGERTAPRRIWFVVDRQIVVDEAFRRAEAIAEELQKAADGPLKTIADRLLRLGGFKDTAPPLAVGRLRGGVIRDDGWARVPSQPAILTSTVDQVGSRLLFRGYGFSDSLAPIHAGLAGNDSLIILDEAHCAKPFLQTLSAVRDFRSPRWAKEPISLPFQFAVMSATLSDDGEENRKCFPEHDERSAALDHPVLRERTEASKLADLAVAKAPGKAKKGQPRIGEATSDDPLVLAAAQRALEWVKTSAKRRVAVMVNRVATAQAVHRQLCRDFGDDADIVLLTGRMRPLDRDLLVDRWEPFLRANDPEEPTKPIILVTTQCLEVGADYSFDALVTECASLDALRQRFGRLDRLGRLRESQALILIRPEDAKEKTEDPVYGFAMAKTWKWIQSVNEGEPVDFGIAALDAVLPTKSDELRPLYAESEDAPVLLPAHLDALCQTSPRPQPTPDIDLFLHGQRRRSAEVQVIWRADLAVSESGEPDADAWIESLALLPPTTAESLTVPLHRFVAWLTKSSSGEDGDVEGMILPEKENEKDKKPPRRAQTPVLLWRGRRESRMTRDPRDICPGDRIILPASIGIEGLGQPVPANGLGREGRDIAERASLTARPGIAFRFTRSALSPWEKHPAVKEFFAWLHETEGGWAAGEAREELTRFHETIRQPLESDDAESEPIPPWPDWLMALWNELFADSARLRVTAHPSGGLFLSAPRKKSSSDEIEEDLFADADDGASRASGDAVSLAQHTRDVVFATEQFAVACLPPDLLETFRFSATVHDLGKLDPRFQVLLRNGDEAAALADGVEPLAKSENLSQSRAQRNRIRQQTGLPDGFRHEALSWQLMADLGAKSDAGADRSLASHLVASHHGYGRPLHPFVEDPNPPTIDLDRIGISRVVSEDDRHGPTPAHRLDSGLTETFWQLNRRFGWWGLAGLETVFRLADWYASKHPQCAPKDSTPFSGVHPPKTALRSGDGALPTPVLLSGLDGANPLGYLAALGVLRVLTASYPHHALRMRWVSAQGGWRPELLSERPLSKDEIVKRLHAQGIPLESMFSAKLLSEAPEFGPVNKKGERNWTDKLMFPIEVYRDYLKDAVRRSSAADPLRAEWAAAWAGETSPQENNKTLVCRRTRFDFTAGQQCFIGMLRELRESVAPDDISATLFGPWRYSASATSLRWDPLDEKRQYALQAFDPTNSSANPSLSDPGANFLAVGGLAFYPFMPDRRANQPGFHGRGESRRFQSRIWECPLDSLSLQTLLSLPENLARFPTHRLGVAQILESGIVQPSDRYRCFTPSRAV